MEKEIFLKKTVFVVLSILIAGCADAALPAGEILDDMSKQFLSSSLLRKGMKRSQTADLLGKEVVTGYVLVDQASGQYNPVTTENPKRSEIFKRNNRSYVVDYYLVGIKIADDKIADDELLPLVFHRDILIGFGWEFFNKQVKGQ